MSYDFTKIKKNIIRNYFIKWNNIEVHAYMQIVEFKNVIKDEFIFKHVSKKVSDTETQLLKQLTAQKLIHDFHSNVNTCPLDFHD